MFILWARSSKIYARSPGAGTLRLAHYIRHLRYCADYYFWCPLLPKTALALSAPCPCSSSALCDPEIFARPVSRANSTLPHPPTHALMRYPSVRCFPRGLSLSKSPIDYGSSRPAYCIQESSVGMGVNIPYYPAVMYMSGDAALPPFAQVAEV